LAVRDVNMDKSKNSQNLNNSTKDAIGYSAMVGFGETYMSAYAIFKGAAESVIGYISSVPFFVGSLLQIFAPYAMKKLRMRKDLLLLFVLLNAVSWLLIISTIFISSEAALPLILIFFTIYMAANMFGGSVWSSWIADLVPENMRGTYFGQRNALAQIAAVLATIMGGIILDVFKDGTTFLGFSIIFVLAFLCRMASWHFLSKIEDPPYYYEKTHFEDPVSFLKRKDNSELKQSILIFAFFYFAVFLMSPFFILYMIRDLHFTYLEYMMVIMSSAIVRIFAMPYWGKISERFGNKIVMVSCAFFVSLIPIYWFFLTDPFQLMFFEVLSGLVWAGIDLCLFNYLLSMSKREEISSTISNYSFFMSMGRLLGPNVGAALLLFLGTFAFFGMDSIHELMVISVIVRFLAFLLLAVSFKEQSLLRDKKKVVLDLVILYPTRDLIHGIVWAFDAGKNAVKNRRKILSRR